MTTITFDTLKFANRLKAAGMEPRLAEEQAGAMAEVLEHHAKASVTKEILRHELIELEQRMIIKLGTLMVITVGSVATLFKLF